jgi:hypothetical protein
MRCPERAGQQSSTAGPDCGAPRGGPGFVTWCHPGTGIVGTAPWRSTVGLGPASIRAPRRSIACGLYRTQKRLRYALRPPRYRPGGSRRSAPSCSRKGCGCREIHTRGQLGQAAVVIGGGIAIWSSRASCRTILNRSPSSSETLTSLQQRARVMPPALCARAVDLMFSAGGRPRSMQASARSDGCATFPLRTSTLPSNRRTAKWLVRLCLASICASFKCNDRRG